MEVNKNDVDFFYWNGKIDIIQNMVSNRNHAFQIEFKSKEKINYMISEEQTETTPWLCSSLTSIRMSVSGRRQFARTLAQCQVTGTAVSTVSGGELRNVLPLQCQSCPPMLRFAHQQLPQLSHLLYWARNEVYPSRFSRIIGHHS